MQKVMQRLFPSEQSLGSVEVELEAQINRFYEAAFRVNNHSAPLKRWSELRICGERQTNLGNRLHPRSILEPILH